MKESAAAPINPISEAEEAAKERPENDNEWSEDGIPFRIRLLRGVEYRFDVGCSDDLLDDKRKQKSPFRGADVIDIDGRWLLFGLVVTRRSFQLQLLSNSTPCTHVRTVLLYTGDAG